MMLLEVVAATKQFGRLAAVRDVSLAVPQGELRAVIGPNGAGKTTFFNLISGLFPPSAGRVVFDGRDVTGLPAHARVRLNHERDAAAAPGAADFSGKRALTARGRNHLVDQGRRNRAQIAPAEFPLSKSP